MAFDDTTVTPAAGTPTGLSDAGRQAQDEAALNTLTSPMGRTFDSGAPQVPFLQGQGPLAPGANTPTAPVIDSGYPAGSFSDKLAQSLRATAAHPATPALLDSPGGFSKMLLSSTLDALSGVGASLGDAAHATDTKGGGWLTGVTNTLAARNERLAGQQARQDKLAQQAKENARQDTQLDLEKQRTAAQIANAHADEIMHAKMSRNSDFEYQEKVRQSAQSQAQPFIDEGAKSLGRGLTKSQLDEQIKSKGIDPTQALAFNDGYVDAVGPDGKPILDEMGQPKQQATWMLLSNVPDVTLSQTQADYLTKYANNGTWQAGQKLPGADYYAATKQAQLAEGADLKMQEAKSLIAERLSAAERNKMEAREKSRTDQDKAANREAERLFSPYLAQANGDVIQAYNLMAADPNGKKNIGKVQSYFGPGNLEKYRHDEITTLESTINKNQKTLDTQEADPLNSSTALTSIVGQSNKTILDPKASASDKKKAQSALDAAQQTLNDRNEIRQEINAAKAKRNTYLGLHPQDPDRIVALKRIGDSLPAENRAQLITNSSALTPQEKQYLLGVYGLNPPGSQPAAPTTQPAPATR